MNEEMPKEPIWKGINFWIDEIEKAGVINDLKHFNDVITEKRPPHPKSGYQEPVLTDVVLDGKKSDIYHADSNNRDTSYNRVFIHIKE